MKSLDQTRFYRKYDQTCNTGILTSSKQRLQGSSSLFSSFQSFLRDSCEDSAFLSSILFGFIINSFFCIVALSSLTYEFLIAFSRLCGSFISSFLKTKLRMIADLSKSNQQLEYMSIFILKSSSFDYIINCSPSTIKNNIYLPFLTGQFYKDCFLISLGGKVQYSTTVKIW